LPSLNPPYETKNNMNKERTITYNIVCPYCKKIIDSDIKDVIEKEVEIRLNEIARDVLRGK